MNTYSNNNFNQNSWKGWIIKFFSDVLRWWAFAILTFIFVWLTEYLLFLFFMTLTNIFNWIQREFSTFLFIFLFGSFIVWFFQIIFNIIQMFLAWMWSLIFVKVPPKSLYLVHIYLLIAWWIIVRWIVDNYWLNTQYIEWYRIAAILTDIFSIALILSVLEANYDFI